MHELELFTTAHAIENLVEREQFLDRVCAGDPARRSRLDRLLHPPPAGADLLSDLPTASDSQGERTAAGPLLLSRYQVLSILGRGGMGIVHEAFDPQLQRSVAIKTLRAERFLTPEDRQRFANEAIAVAKLHHQNIVQLHEIGTHDGASFLVMELLTGGSLVDRIKDRSLTPMAAAGVARQLAEAAHHAHMGGVIHRDLKPANVLFNAEGVLKVTDFGAARFVPNEGEKAPAAALTSASVLIGTPHYMAPEQARGGAITSAVDVHAIGVILYEMLTGRRPFEGTESFEIITAVVNEEPVLPSRMNRRVPPDLETICLKCLQKQPGRRYASALELAEDLRRFERGEPIVARPASLARRLWVHARKRPALAGTLLGSLLAGFVGIAALSWQFQQTLRERDAAKVEAELAEEARGKMAVERDRAESRLYASRISQAHALVEAGNLVRAKQLLDECRPTDPQHDRRNWEWGYLARRTSPEVWSLTAARNATRQDTCPRLLAVSPSGRLVASVGGDLYTDDLNWDLLVPATIQIADTATGETRGVWPDCLPVSAQSLTWLSESKLLAIDHLGAATCWDAPSGKSLGGWASPGDLKRRDTVPVAAVVSPSRAHVVRNQDARTIATWDIARGVPDRVVSLPENARICHVLDDDRWLMRGGRGWFVASAKDGRELVHFSSASDRCVVTPDRDRVITFAHESSPEAVACWDAKTGQKLWENTAHVQATREFVISPNGDLGVQILPHGHQHFARVWDLRTGRTLHELRGHRARIVTAKFSPDGIRVATCSEDGTLRTWNAATGEPLQVDRGHEATIRCFDFSPDGALVVSGAMDSRLLAWDAGVFQPGPTLPGDLEHAVREEGPLFGAMGFTPDGVLRILNTANGVLDVEPGTGNPIAFRKLDGLAPRKTFFLNDFACDGPAARFAGHVRDRRELVVWDGRTSGTIFSQPDVGGQVMSVALSPDGQRVACGAATGEGQDRVWRTTVWAVDTRECLYRDERPQPCAALCFYGGGRSVARGGPDGEGASVDGIDLATREARPIMTEKAAGVRLIRFAPSGQLLVVLAVPGGSRLVCWDLAEARAVWTSRVQDRIAGLAVSPDGQRLAAGLLSDAVTLIDFKTGEAILDLKVNVNRHGDPGFPAGVLFSPDGRFLAMNNSTNTCAVWEADLASDQPSDRADRARTTRERSRYFHHLLLANLARETANPAAFRYHRERLEALPPPTARLRELQAWVFDGDNP